MSLRISLFIDSIQSKQSLIDDTVTYSLCGKLLGSDIVLPVPTEVIRKIDKMLQGDDAQENVPTYVPDLVQASINNQTPQGYEFGIMYGENDE